MAQPDSSIVKHALFGVAAFALGAAAANVYRALRADPSDISTPTVSVLILTSCISSCFFKFIYEIQDEKFLSYEKLSRDQVIELRNKHLW